MDASNLWGPRSSPACVSTAGSADPATTTTSLARATSSSSHSAAEPATGYGCFVYAIRAAIRLGHEHATTLHFSTDGQPSHRWSYAGAATFGHDYAATVCVSSDSQSNYIWSHASSTSISYEPNHDTARCHDAYRAHAVRTAFRAASTSQHNSLPNTYIDRSPPYQPPCT